VIGDTENPRHLYPSLVSTLRVICSICDRVRSRPWAQSVDPDVRTVAPASFVYVPNTRGVSNPVHRRGSRVPKIRDAMYCNSLGSSGFGGRGADSRVKCCVGHVPKISKVAGVPSSPVGTEARLDT